MSGILVGAAARPRTSFEFIRDRAAAPTTMVEVVG
jgi:hypothetical protein